MATLLLSLPDHLASRFKSAVPARKRSQFVATLLEREMGKQDDTLYKAALAVEKDRAVNADIKAWDITAADGLDETR